MYVCSQLKKIILPLAINIQLNTLKFIITNTLRVFQAATVCIAIKIMANIFVRFIDINALKKMAFN